ncbi:inositol 2-dehydrogenase [Brevibacillus centrosporus]|uniref:inositol 2-dehydrogenase n=1 Tax=Brevibacillus centrosporus TaxID=54910 RepID=UPI00380A4502
MKEKIRCAVLGLGRLGYWHAENLAAKVKGAKLASVVDPLAGQAEKVARELGVAAFSQFPEEVMADPAIDAVIIATPTSTHAEMIKLAATHGKHIFVEKPITSRLDLADELIEVIEKQGVHCMVGFMRRFDPAYAEAKRRIFAGDIGKPIYYKGISRDPGSPPPEFIRHSGGIFLDLSIHDYDIARFLLDAEVESVSAHGRILLHDFMQEFSDVDQAITYLTFDSGAAGDIEASRNASYGYDIRGEVVGTEGTLMIGSHKYHDVHILNAQGKTHGIVPAFPQRFRESYLLEMEHFIESLRKGQKPSVTQQDGRAALAIAIAARQSFEAGAAVSLHTPTKPEDSSVV